MSSLLVFIKKIFNKYCLLKDSTNYNIESRAVFLYKMILSVMLLLSIVFLIVMILTVNMSSRSFYIDFLIIIVMLLTICSSFVYFYNDMVSQYLKIKYQLNIFTDIINNISNIDDFKENYSDVGKRITQIDNYIGNIWWEFCETLIIKRVNKSEQNIQSYDIKNNPIIFLANTAQTELYINSETIIDKQISRDLLDVIPGILTGLGLFGTFFAIAIALMGFKLGTTAQIETSIQNLLGGLSIKFVSSLAGIATSIIFLFAKSKFFSNLDDSISKLQNKLNRIFPRRTSEAYLCNIYQKLNEYDEYNKNIIAEITQIKENLSNIKNEVSDQGEDAMNLYSLIDDMNECMKKFYTDTDFKDAIKNAVSEGLSNSKGDITDAINISLEKLDKIKHNVFEKMDAIKDELNNTLNNLNTSIANSISSSMNNSLTIMSNDFQSAMTSLMDAMNELKSLKQESSANLVERMITELKETIGGMQSSFTKAIVGGSGDTINTLQESLKDSSSYLATLKDTFAMFMSEMQEQLKNESEQRNNAVSKAVSDTIKQVNLVNLNVQECIDKQNLKLGEWANNIQVYIDNLHLYEENLENNYAAVLDKLDSTLVSQNNLIGNNENYARNLSLASDNIKSTASNLVSASSTIIDVLEKTTDASNTLSQSLNTSDQIVRTTSSTISELEQSVKNLNNNLASNIIEFSNKSKDVQNMMFKDFSVGVKNALGEMMTVSSCLVSCIEDLSEILDRLEGLNSNNG